MVTILFLAANPLDTDRLKLGLEAREIGDALRRSRHGQGLHFEPQQAVRVEDLQALLLEHRPALLHFSGHGSPASEIVLEDEEGRARPVPRAALADLFAHFEGELRCVVLSACYSAEQARAIAEHVDCVIGMPSAIPDELALAFADAFYRAIGYGETIGAAFRLACNRIELEGGAGPARDMLPEAGAAGETFTDRAAASAPLLIARDADAEAIRLVGRPPLEIRRPATWIPALRARASARALALGAGLALLLAAALLTLARDPAIRRSFAGPEPMRGDLNVAVAAFGALDAEGRSRASEEAEDLAERVYRQLAQEAAALSAAVAATQGAEPIAIEIRPPSETGRVDGATPQERAERAELLAEASRAHVIVYGNLDQGEASSQFLPEFYVSKETRALAEELAGQHELGAAIEADGDIAANPVARAALRDQVARRTQVLTRFVIGLGYFVLGQYAEAQRQFEAAEPQWERESGKELLYLFMGNTAGRLRDLAAAERHYREAITLRPGYSRAQLGLAEVAFQRARADCSAERADRAGLEEALRGFEAARAAPDPPALASIPSKAAFGIGRASMCLSRAGAGDRWAEAEAAFAAVVADHAAGNERVIEEAVESQANIGLLHLMQAEAGASEAAAAQLRRAREGYAAAIALNAEIRPRRPCREGLFRTWQADIALRLAECPAAAEALGRADDAYARCAEPVASNRSFLDTTRFTFTEACGGSAVGGSP